METIGKRILTVAVGLLLAGGVPFFATTAAHAEPGCGCECPCGEKSDCGDHHGKHEGMHGKKGGAHEGHMSGKHMKEGMTRHMEEVRGMIDKLRALEAKMATLKSKEDGPALHAASLEHAKLLTDLQESHLKHMETMMGK